MPLQCRFYENQFPSCNEVVVVTVKSIEPMGSYVDLLEYKNIGGLILHSELSRRRIRSLNKLVRVGKNEIVLVIRVDSSKGYIDLSKRRVAPEEISKCQERFAKAKAVNQIIRHVAEKLGYKKDEELEELCRNTCWYFDRKYGKSGASYDVFKKAVTNPSVLDECSIEEPVKELLLQDIRHRLMPQAVKIRADFEVSCFTYEGIDAVKRALRAGLYLSTEEMPIKINLMAPPLYVLTAQTLEWNEGLAHLNNVLSAIKVSIEEQKGTFKIQQAPRIVSDTDEADLRRHMAELEEANREVSGDDDEDEGEDGEGEEEEDGSEPEQENDTDVAAKII
ncbi:unnamed protein product [Protopolystoma xenopodis]|uniref:Eukaryotic translation initiation factor 2 subunit 1 n=1 Tax=Protopolystoma xenopodis TaxID=117903 RepID=A0A3S5BPQ8_9PLAT|nr:unnamed protein product [Protopolystoma xenopodis]